MTAAVAGSPTDVALETIAELEPFDRGRYAGPVGWFDRHGEAMKAFHVRDGLGIKLAQRAGIEVAVGPAVAAMADAGRHRVVDGRVAQRAGDADPRDPAIDDLAAHADHRVERDQRDGGGGIREVGAGEHVGRHRVGVDLEADAQRRGRRQVADELVQPEDVGPQLLVAERVVAENARAVAGRARADVAGRRWRIVIVVVAARGGEQRGRDGGAEAVAVSHRELQGGCAMERAERRGVTWRAAAWWYLWGMDQAELRALLAAIPDVTLDEPAAVARAIDAEVAYLASDEALASLARDTYWPKWRSPWWSMVLLDELGHAARIPARAAAAMVAGLDALRLHTFPIRADEWPAGADKARDASCHCAVGSIDRVLTRCAIDVPAALPWIAAWYPRYQLADGGYNCDEAAYLVTDECPSSMVGTVAPLEAMTARAASAVADRAAAMVLGRALVRGSATRHNAEERVAAASWGATRRCSR